MKKVKKQNTLEQLQTIPGIGPSIALDLIDLNVNSPEDLKNRNPQDLYDNLGKIRGKKIDPCVLYVFRCAKYFLSHKHHNLNLLKWWNWKDKII